MSIITVKDFFDHFADHLEFIELDNSKKGPDQVSIKTSTTKVKYKCNACETTYDKPRVIRKGICTTKDCPLKNGSKSGLGEKILKALLEENKLLEVENIGGSSSSPLTYKKLFDHYNMFYEAEDTEALDQIIGEKNKYKIRYTCKMCESEYERDSLGKTFICNYKPCVLNREELQIDKKIMKALLEGSLLDTEELLSLLGEKQTHIKNTGGSANSKSLEAKRKEQRIPKLMDELSRLSGVDRDLLESFIKENMNTREVEGGKDKEKLTEEGETITRGVIDWKTGKFKENLPDHIISGTKEEREKELKKRKAKFIQIPESDTEDEESEEFEIIQ